MNRIGWIYQITFQATSEGLGELTRKPLGGNRAARDRMWVGVGRERLTRRASPLAAVMGVEASAGELVLASETKERRGRRSKTAGKKKRRRE